MFRKKRLKIKTEEQKQETTPTVPMIRRWNREVTAGKLYAKILGKKYRLGIWSIWCQASIEKDFSQHESKDGTALSWAWERLSKYNVEMFAYFIFLLSKQAQDEFMTWQDLYKALEKENNLDTQLYHQAIETINKIIWCFNLEIAGITSKKKAMPGAIKLISGLIFTTLFVIVTGIFLL